MAKENLKLILNQTKKTIDPIIKELLDSYVDKKFQKLVEYQIFTGGKRLRPALAIVCFKLLGAETEDILYPAAGLEILHNYSLIVDDIIDNSSFRRRKSTTWFKFGKSIAECAGIYYSSAAFQAANQSKESVLISEIFVKTLKTMTNGEILDILFRQTGKEKEPYILRNRYKKITKKDYYKMISKKTASLLEACCEVGGICAKASSKQLKALKDYGFNLGIAFQIQDDILDIFGEGKKFGKKIGKDIEERNLGNIVILFALNELPRIDKGKILRILRKKEIKNRDIKEIIKLIKKTEACQNAYQFGEGFIEKAKTSLKLLPQNKWNEILKGLANFAVKRKD